MRAAVRAHTLKKGSCSTLELADLGMNVAALRSSSILSLSLGSSCRRQSAFRYDKTYVWGRPHRVQVEVERGEERAALLHSHVWRLEAEAEEQRLSLEKAAAQLLTVQSVHWR